MLVLEAFNFKHQQFSFPLLKKPMLRWQRKRFSKKFDSGFTLIELLVVIAIIGILAAVAIPYYQGYMIRARLLEVEHAMSIVESAVTAYHQEKEDSWPNCATIDEVRNSLGVSLGALNRIGDISIINGEITVTVANIHPMVDGKWIRLTPAPNVDGSVGWNWGWSPDFPPHLRQRRN
jgi:type IV pilus assembly protein PilA